MQAQVEKEKFGSFLMLFLSKIGMRPMIGLCKFTLDHFVTIRVDYWPIWS